MATRRLKYRSLPRSILHVTCQSLIVTQRSYDISISRKIFPFILIGFIAFGFATTFKIYLPRVKDEAEVKTAEDSDKKSAAAVGTILLVEDEAIVRSLTRQNLEECGYTIIEARNGLEAL